MYSPNGWMPASYARRRCSILNITDWGWQQCVPSRSSAGRQHGWMPVSPSTTSSCTQKTAPIGWKLRTRQNCGETVLQDKNVTLSIRDEGLHMTKTKKCQGTMSLARSMVCPIPFQRICLMLQLCFCMLRQFCWEDEVRPSFPPKDNIFE